MDINTNNFVNPFIPDLGPSSKDAAASPAAGAAAGTPSFADTVKSFLTDVSDKVNQSDQLSQDLATGRTTDTSKVVTSVEEANMSMSFTLAIRNKLLDAYSEIERMQV